MTKIVLLNGPPRSGKDAAAKYCANKFQGVNMKFATPLKESFACMFLGHIVKNRGMAAALEYIEEHKDEPQLGHPHTTIRETLIYMSEEWMKPMYGDDIFGRLFVDSAAAWLDMAEKQPLSMPFIFVSDSGFDPEAQAVVEAYGTDDVVCVQIKRPGTSFAKDSRNYLNCDVLGIRRVKINNDGTLDEYLESIHVNVGSYLEGVELVA